MLESPVEEDGREVFLPCLPITLCFWVNFQKGLEKNSPFEGGEINALRPLIGQCVAESLGEALVRERK